MGMRVALTNHKGGVGKTACAIALAEAAALLGMKVLLVDMDAQANLSRRTGAVPLEPGHTLSECLKVGVQHGAAAFYGVHHGWKDRPELVIDVLPADLGLEQRVHEAAVPGSHFRLRKALFGADSEYDLTIIDCPPSIGHLTEMSLAALDGVYDTALIPLTPEYDAIDGALRSVEYIAEYRDGLGVERLEATGLIVNNIRMRVGLHESRIEDLPGLMPKLPVLAYVPQRIRFAEVMDAGEPISSEPSLKPVLESFERVVRTLLARKEVVSDAT